MSTKVKLFTTLIAIMVVIASIGVGVYAAQQSSFTTGSTVSFRAESVYISVDADTQILNEEKANVFNARNFAGEVGSSASIDRMSAWTIDNALTLTETNNYVVYTVKVTNHSPYAAAVKYTAPNGTKLANLTVDQEVNGATITDANITIPSNGTATYIIKIAIANFTQEVDSANVEFSFIFTRAV